jgi:N-acetylneuraminic acid mutarotase
MIVWGGDLGITIAGCCAGYVDTGGRYDPVTDSWTLTSGRYGARGHTAVWTGNHMVVWGGRIGDVDLDAGGRYDPVTDSWTDTTSIGAPAPRRNHTAVWTGDEMIVWGGVVDDPGGDPSYHDTGGRYDPVTDSWTGTATIGAPDPRAFHTAVWTDEAMIVWGGDDPPDPGSYSPFSSGGRYDPATDTWAATSLVDAPVGRLQHTAVWTGNRMIVWGGVDTPFPPNTPYNTGGRYDPVSDTWAATSAIGAPQARYWHTAVWTGERMIVWGGLNATQNPVNTGSRYFPLFDTWTATSNAPLARAAHTAVWTGDEMIVWGGVGVGIIGGRYTPATNTWATTSTVGEPSADSAQTAVWTGELMLVWGGSAAGGAGGRYLPAASADADADSRCSFEDCNDAEGGVWATPGEVTDLAFTDSETLSWSPPSDLGGTSVLYDAIRSGDPTDFVSTPTCIAPSVGNTEADASAVPDPDEAFFYLVRAVNSCPLGLGSPGADSNGAPRTALECP